jgi:hypothetical protein
MHMLYYGAFVISARSMRCILNRTLIQLDFLPGPASRIAAMHPVAYRYACSLFLSSSFELYL